MTIRRLDPDVASRIAAGEVVERPASCVKELVENALDSGAGRISVFVEGGGLDLIKVVDDGSGIAREDLPLALERYATSKLRDVADLQSISTLGFRGEALPSIAAVSEMTIATRSREEASGAVITARGGRILSVEEWGGPPGTTVTVRDLFFNVPARLEFMKSRGRELELIAETVTRLALAWPEVAFSVYSGKRCILRTDGKGLASAVVNLFGPEALERLLPVSYSSGDLRLEGYCGKPGFTRRNRSCQFFSVRRRPVRSPLFYYALDQAYSGLVREGEHPFAIVDATVPAGGVDVNVHPQKTEVRFKDENLLKTRLVAAFTLALTEAGFLRTGREGSPAHASPGTGFYFARSDSSSREGAGTAGPGQFSPGRLFLARETSGRPGLPEGYEYLGRLWNTFIVFSSPEALIVLDQHAFSEALAYLELARDEHHTQMLLTPVTVVLDPGKVELYQELEPLLEKVGFSARLAGERSILVTGVPVVLGRAMDPAEIRTVLETCTGRDLAAVRASVAACHSSVRAGDELTPEEAGELIRAFLTNPDLKTCPHGRPVAYQLPRGEIFRFFRRGR